jgi:SnoaL-like domain
MSPIGQNRWFLGVESRPESCHSCNGYEEERMNPMDIVLHFLERINQHNADKLAELMTESHVFIDSLGNAVTGREKMRLGWRNYYAFCPDYWVSHEGIFSEGFRVAIFGAAGGAIAVNGKALAENKWRTPAAWLAVVENGLVSKWQVYADNKPVYDIIAKSTANRGT